VHPVEPHEIPNGPVFAFAVHVVEQSPTWRTSAGIAFATKNDVINSATVLAARPNDVMGVPPPNGGSSSGTVPPRVH
jgi:hypothetical protein